ncbi:Caltractin [Trichinella pseudospiralis]|uniref:Caltractin n=1 Tax=Trichinella pseudospiralis TaxID=6337 RepID=A0A0V1FI05_TRIPS|nr:Caltractin [Trichinella pseudospiralis]KRY85664.1 Caltractin [Trichinella pseudospiralis]
MLLCDDKVQLGSVDESSKSFNGMLKSMADWNGKKCSDSISPAYLKPTSKIALDLNYAGSEYISLKVLAEVFHCTRTEMELYQQLYISMTKEHADGDKIFLRVEDIQRRYDALNVPVERDELEKLIADISENDATDEIDFVEFVELLTRKVTPSYSESENFAIFKIFDSDEDGFVTVSDIANVCNRIFLDDEENTEVNFKQIISLLNKGNDNGRISCHDFMNYLQQDKEQS